MNLTWGCWFKIHNPIQQLISNNLSMITRKYHMRLKMNIMMQKHSYWRKKLPKNVQKYGRMHYTCRPKRKNSPKGTFSKWTLNLTVDCWCTIHNRIQHLAWINLSTSKRKYHMRLQMDIMIQNHSYWRKKLPKNVQKYGRIHYTSRPKRKNSPKWTVNKWALNLKRILGAKFIIPSNIWFRITDQWWKEDAIWDSKWT